MAVLRKYQVKRIYASQVRRSTANLGEKGTLLLSRCIQGGSETALLTATTHLLMTLPLSQAQLPLLTHGPATVFETELEALGTTTNIVLQATRHFGYRLIHKRHYPHGRVLNPRNSNNNTGDLGTGISISEDIIATAVSATTGTFGASAIAAPISLAGVSSSGNVNTGSSGSITLNGAVVRLWWHGNG